MHAGAALCLSTDGMYETAVRTRTMGQVDGPDPLRAQTGMRMRAAAVRTRLSFFVAGRPERDLGTYCSSLGVADSSVVRWRCGRGREERTVRPVTRRRPVASALVSLSARGSHLDVHACGYGTTSSRLHLLRLRAAYRVPSGKLSEAKHTRHDRTVVCEENYYYYCSRISE
jgi:hypothetical protein